MATDARTKQERIEEIKKADANVKTMEDFTSPDILYHELIDSVRKYHPSDDISRISSIRFVWALFWQIWSLTKKQLWPGFFMMWWRTR